MVAARDISPVGAVVKGAVAGVAGTLAMDMLGWARYRRAGGEDGFAAWEFSAGLTGYDQAPAPAQVGRRLVEGYLQKPLAPGTARPMNNTVHLITGTQWGIVHGILSGSSSRRGALGGIRTAAMAWVSSYALLGVAGIYDPIWTYRARVLADDASGHLVYGLTTATVFDVLAGGPGGAE